jgi:hypothetical protein
VKKTLRGVMYLLLLLVGMWLLAFICVCGEVLFLGLLKGLLHV